jgi:hypothetical protein
MEYCPFVANWMIQKLYWTSNPTRLDISGECCRPWGRCQAQPVFLTMYMLSKKCRPKVLVTYDKIIFLHTYQDTSKSVLSFMIPGYNCQADSKQVQLRSYGLAKLLPTPRIAPARWKNVSPSIWKINTRTFVTKLKVGSRQTPLAYQNIFTFSCQLRWQYFPWRAKNSSESLWQAISINDHTKRIIL